jgi:hypothetical protein
LPASVKKLASSSQVHKLERRITTLENGIVRSREKRQQRKIKKRQQRAVNNFINALEDLINTAGE